MGVYEREARCALERIEYFHNNAGPKGHFQARYYYNELAKLIMKARSSKRNKGEASIIAIFRKEVEPLMKEMKRWEDEWKKEEGERKKL